MDDEIASIYLDLDFRSIAPVSSKPVMAYIRVRLNNPRPDGLSSDKDFDVLSTLEDSLVDEGAAPECRAFEPVFQGGKERLDTI